MSDDEPTIFKIDEYRGTQVFLCETSDQCPFNEDELLDIIIDAIHEALDIYYGR